jgi:hypothetical protein
MCTFVCRYLSTQLASIFYHNAPNLISLCFFVLCRTRCELDTLHLHLSLDTYLSLANINAGKIIDCSRAKEKPRNKSFISQSSE